MADKFCSNCGSKNPEQTNFCASCGSPLAAAASAVQPMEQPYPAYPPQPQPPQNPPYQQPYPMAPMPAPAFPALPQKKKHKGLRILLGFAAAIVLLVVGIAALLGAGANKDYYSFGKDRIPSVKLALGEKRKLTGAESGVENGANVKAFTYNEPGRDQALEMSAYLKYLREKDGFLLLTDVDFSTPEAWCKVGRNSVDAGHQLVLQIEYDPSGYRITIIKEPGEITPNADEAPAPYNDDPYAQPNNYQPPATQALTPPGPSSGTGNLTKSIISTLEGGTYHTKEGSRDAESGLYVESDWYVKDGAMAMRTTAEGITMRTIYQGGTGKVYVAVDEYQMVTVYESEPGEFTLPSMGDTANLTYVGEGSGAFGGSTYQYDEYRHKNGDQLFYFMDGGAWKGLRAVTGNKTVETVILAFDTNVPDSVFDIPANYTEVDANVFQ